MEISARDKEILLAACATEAARLKRAINAASNQGVKELLNTDLMALNDVIGRLSVAPVKGGK